MQLTLAQIEKFRNCLKRKLNKRKYFYPKWIKSGKLMQQKADEIIVRK